MSSGVGVLTLGRGQNCYIVLIYGVFLKSYIPLLKLNLKLLYNLYVPRVGFLIAGCGQTGHIVLMYIMTKLILSHSNLKQKMFQV